MEIFHLPYSTVTLILPVYFYVLHPGGRAINNVYNNSTLVPVHVQDLNCTGTESSLQECQFDTSISNFCMNQSNTAGVECYFQGIIKVSYPDTSLHFSIFFHFLFLSFFSPFSNFFLPFPPCLPSLFSFSYFSPFLCLSNSSPSFPSFFPSLFSSPFSYFPFLSLSSHSFILLVSSSFSLFFFPFLIHPSIIFSFCLFHLFAEG